MNTFTFHPKYILSTIITFSVVAVSMARTITSEEAALATSKWLESDPKTFDPQITSRNIREVRTAKDKNGISLFHIVRLLYAL